MIAEARLDVTFEDPPVPPLPASSAMGMAETFSNGSSPISQRPFNRLVVPEQRQDLHHHRPYEVAYERVTRERNLRKLEALFSVADTDGNRSLSLEEFRDSFKIPWVKRAFSALGVQPHQSEIVYRRMVFEANLEAALAGAAERKYKGADKTAALPEELDISSFVDSLGAICGAEGDELDISGLARANLSKARPPSTTLSYSSTSSGWRGNGGANAIGSSASARGRTLPRALSTAAIGLGLDPGLGRTYLEPDKMRIAFVQSASARALHPANATRRRFG